MLVRIVKMTFRPENIPVFEEIFYSSSPLIRSFEGCQHLELWKSGNNQYYTYSLWKSAAALENYRQSELFKTVWAKTKILFEQKPEAFSYTKL